ncbi:MAG: hypothetical protein ABR575_09070 [Actinomycetota bacterium]
MRRPRIDLVALAMLVAAFSFTALPVANAYIDPGSGSYIFQLLVGAALGVGVGLKVFWHRIANVFRRDRSSPEE